MIVHFVGDYFHYDNKFWRTIKTMFTKPGLITKEYIEGKRVKYLNPIQLYIFVTTVFFVFFMPRGEENSPTIDIKDTSKLIPQNQIRPPEGLTGISTESGNTQIGIGKYTPKESTKEEYDSVQNSLPKEQRDGFLLRHVRHKSYDRTQDFGVLLMKNFSKVFFLLLPFFALLLSILFFRKKAFFIDHAIFSIHFHSFVFMLFIVGAIFMKFIENESIIGVILGLILLGIGLYLFKSLRLIYPSHPFKIFVKQIALFVFYFIGFLLSLVILTAVLYLFF